MLFYFCYSYFSMVDNGFYNIKTSIFNQLLKLVFVSSPFVISSGEK